MARILLPFLAALAFVPPYAIADPPTLPTQLVTIGWAIPDRLSVDPGQLTRPTELYTVCALGGAAEHGFIRDGKVYAPGGGGVFCWDLQTGEVLNRYPQIGGATMPLLEHGLLVGVGGGNASGVSVSDGKTQWSTPVGSVWVESLAYWEEGENHYVFVQSREGLFKLRLEDGAVLAKFDIGSRCIPAIDGKERAVYAQAANRLVKLKLDDLSLIWEVALKGPDSYSSPILVDDAKVGRRIFTNLQNGNIYCLTPEGEIVWEHAFGGDMNGLMTYFEGMLIEQGYPSIVRAVDGRTGEVLWVFDSKDLHESKETFWTAPILIGGRLLIATADGPGRLYHRQKYFVLEPRTGEKLSQFEFDAPGSSCGVPMASGGIVIFHDNMHSRWTAVKVGEGELVDWYPFRGDAAHTGAPAYQEKIVTKWYDEPQILEPWRQVRDWLFLDRFEREDMPVPGKPVFPPFAWKHEGPEGSTVIRGGELVITGADKEKVGVYNEFCAAGVYTVEGTVTLNQTDAPNQWFALLACGWQRRLGLMAHSDGFIYYMGSSQGKDLIQSDVWLRSDLRYEANKTHHFRIRVDCEDKTGVYFMDGTELGKVDFFRYYDPVSYMAATQDSSGSFRLGELRVFRGDTMPDEAQLKEALSPGGPND